MKRKDFLKRIGIGAAAVVVAPKVIAEAIEQDKPTKAINLDKLEKGIDNKIEKFDEWFEDKRATYPKGYSSPLDLIKIYEKTG